MRLLVDRAGDDAVDRRRGRRARQDRRLLALAALALVLALLPVALPAAGAAGVPGVATAAASEPMRYYDVGPLPVPLQATAGGEQVHFAVYSTGGGWSPFYAGPDGSRYLVWFGRMDSWVPQHRLIGNTRDCPEEPWPVLSPGRDDRECWEVNIVPEQTGSFRYALTAPLHAFAHDTARGGPGAPVVFKDWHFRHTGLEPGLQGGACGTGFVGYRAQVRMDDGRSPGFEFTQGVELRVRHHMRQQHRPGFDMPTTVPAGTVERNQIEYAPPVPDVSAPVIGITSPADCQQVAQGDQLALRYSCTDPRVDLSKPDTTTQECAGPVADGELLDTSTPGWHTATVRAQDLAGNRRTASVRYLVHASAEPQERLPGGTVDMRELLSLEHPGARPGALGVGERGLLRVTLHGESPRPLPPAEVVPPYSSRSWRFTTRGLQHADGTQQQLAFERAVLPASEFINCRAYQPRRDERGVTEQDWLCVDDSPYVAVPSQDVFLPVVGTEVGQHLQSSEEQGNGLTVRVVPPGPPVLTTHLDREPGPAGWHDGPVTAAWSAQDSTGAPLPPPPLVRQEQAGEHELVSEPVCDFRDLCTRGRATVRIDLDDPQVVASVAPEANPAGWHRAAPAVGFTCSDATSGVQSCPGPVAVEQDTAGQEVVGTASDGAGRTGSASVTVRLDRTAPQLVLDAPREGSRVPRGREREATCTAADALSGLAGPCTVTTTRTAGERGVEEVTAVARALDVAGNLTTSTRRWTVVGSGRGRGGGDRDDGRGEHEARAESEGDRGHGRD